MQRRRRIGIAIAQALCELDGKSGGPGHQRKTLTHARPRFRISVDRSQNPVGDLIGQMTRREADDDRFGQASQIFNERDPQRDRNRPHFAYGERLHALISCDEARQPLHVEGAVRVRHDRPGHTENTRIAFQRTVGEFRQLAIVARREVLFDLPDLLIGDMEIVQEPLGRRHNRLMLMGGLYNPAIGFDEDGRIGVEPPRHWTSLERRRCELCLREAFGMLLEALDTEKFGADRLLRRSRVGLHPENIAKT